MNKDLKDFLEGNKNAVMAEAIISREKAQNGFEFIHITIDDIEVFKFWYNSNKKQQKNDKPKHTGGKPSFAKIYLEKLRELKDNSIDPALIGYMIWLADNIEWSSGLLVKGRGKNKTAIKFKDIETILGVGKTKAASIITKLKNSHLLSYDNEGYKVNQDLIRKGV